MTLRCRSVVALAASVAAAGVGSCTKHDAATKTSANARVIQQSTPTNESAILLAAGDSAYFRAEYDSALAIYDRATRDAAARNDSATIARALTDVGLVAWRQGRFADAESIGARALALKQRLKQQADLAKSFNALGLLAHDQGNLETALGDFLAARNAAELVHDSGYVAKARGNLGLVYQDLGDFERARSEMIALREAAAAKGDLRLEGNALNNLGMLETRIGDPEEAIAWLTKARARYASLKYAVGEENALGQLSVAYTERGEPSRALAYLDSAFAVATKHGLGEPEADDLELMAEQYENAGDHRRALEFLRRARAVCDSLRMETKLGHVAYAEATLRGTRQSATGASASREAVDRQRKAEARMDELDAELFVADLAQLAGDTGSVAQAMREASTTADQLGSGRARIRFALGTPRIGDVAGRPRDVLTVLDAEQRDTSLLRPKSGPTPTRCGRARTFGSSSTRRPRMRGAVRCRAWNASGRISRQGRNGHRSRRIESERMPISSLHFSHWGRRTKRFAWPMRRAVVAWWSVLRGDPRTPVARRHSRSRGVGQSLASDRRVDRASALQRHRRIATSQPCA